MEVEAGRRRLRYPLLETQVAALLPSSFTVGGCGGVAQAGQDCVTVFNETNFFSEEYHCQSSDSGVAHWGVDGELRIWDVESVDGFLLHFGFLNRGSLSVGDRVHLKVDEERRTCISSNHTSAHLLNFGIDQIFLGASRPDTDTDPGPSESRGASSSRICRVKPDALIMEFSAGGQIPDAEITQIENLVNLMIYHQVPVYGENLSVKEATSLGLALTPPEDPLGPDDLSRFDVPLDSAEESGIDPLWSGTNKNRDVSTGPLARPFARTAHSFACSGLLALLAPSVALTRGKVNF